MFEELKIDENLLNDAEGYAEQLKNSINDSYQGAEKLKQTVLGASWKGEARDTFLTYLELIMQYHKDLNDTASLQEEALKNLRGYKIDFQAHPKLQELRNL